MVVGFHQYVQALVAVEIPEPTFVDALSRAFGDILPIRCVSEVELEPCAQSSTCAARTVWQTIYDRVSEALNGMTLADL